MLNRDDGGLLPVENSVNGIASKRAGSSCTRSVLVTVGPPEICAPTPTHEAEGCLANHKVNHSSYGELCAGGGVALLYAGRDLDAVKDKLTNFDQQIGVQIVQSALKMPLKTIADNAGVPELLPPIR